MALGIPWNRLPVSLLGFLMAVQGVPSSSQHRGNQPPESKGKYLEAFKGVFANWSAIACFVGNALAMAGFQVILVYSTSFYREHFPVSTEFASIIFVGAALSFTIGTLVIGQFVTQFGRKLVTILTGFITGIFMCSFTNVPNLWLSIALEYLSCLFFGMMITTAYSLTLEQVPNFRGTMMSLNSVAANIGSALGAGIGGWMLLLWDYEFVGLSLGAMILVGAIIYYRVVSDPTRIEVPDLGT
ncbi:MAG: MFS transporter [Candidatus Heimdallarchaeota archaeon]